MIAFYTHFSIALSDCRVGRELPESLSTVLGYWSRRTHVLPGHHDTILESLRQIYREGCARFPHRPLVQKRVHRRAKAIPYRALSATLAPPLGRSPGTFFWQCRWNDTPSSRRRILDKPDQPSVALRRAVVDRHPHLRDTPHHTMVRGPIRTLHYIRANGRCDLVDGLVCGFVHMMLSIALRVSLYHTYQHMLSYNLSPPRMA